MSTERCEFTPLRNATGTGSSPNFPGWDGGFDRPNFVPGQRPPEGLDGGFRPERGERDRRRGGGFGFGRSLMMLVPLSLIVVAFLALERLLDFLRVLRQRLAREKVQPE